MVLRMPVENLDQGPRFGGCGNHWQGRRDGCFVTDTISVRAGRLQCLKKIPNGIRLSNDLDRHPYPERTLNP
jgi:hypothetical protein